MVRSNNEKLSATSSMLLKHDATNVAELIRVLSGIESLRDLKSLQCHGFNIDETYLHKLSIASSLSGQKILRSSASVLNGVGSIFESRLNPQASNHNGVFSLARNLFRGEKLVDKESKDYKSIVAHIDNREELDENITHEDPDKYNAALSIMASKVSYENKSYVEDIVKNKWKMDLVDNVRDYWNEYQQQATTQAFVLLDKSGDHDIYLVAFRGTQMFDAYDWSTDIDISWLGFPGVGKTHFGFMKALGLEIELMNPTHECELESKEGWAKETVTNEKPERAYYFIRDLLNKHLNGNHKAKFILTGHSLGGALAILFASVLIMHKEKFLLERLEGVYTFGQPRVGDKTFANYMNQKLKDYDLKYFRYVYCNDIVPRLPFDNDIMKFEHFGTCLYFDSDYVGKKTEEEPNKNFFSWKEMIPMKLNALKELKRSFNMSKHGSEYEEGRLLRMSRLLGVIGPTPVAGIAAHGPQDYVNITRLGSSPSHLD